MEKRTQFTGSFKNSVSFDKNDIRKTIHIPTSRQARRCAGIYDALIQEFYEEGCLTSAKYFKILMDKECALYNNETIRDRFSDNRKLLLSLFDSCKMAEIARYSKHRNGPVICTRLLLQCIMAIERHKKYDWILIDVFKIIIKISCKICGNEEVSKEPLCRIYYKYGIYLMKSDLQEAIKYLEKSFDLAQDTNWIHMEESHDNKSIYFSSVVGNVYGSALLDYGSNIFLTRPVDAINIAQKALVVLSGVGIERNKSIYIKGNLDMAYYQLKTQNYEACLKILETIHANHADEMLEYLYYLPRYNHLKGLYFKCLKKYDVALVEFYKSLKIMRKLKMKREEGVVLLDTAKVFMNCGRSEFRMAESCLYQSKQIFVDLNDMFNTTKTSYIMANLKVQKIKQLFLDLIKLSSTCYCDKYRLILWKSLCLPFWRYSRHSLRNGDRDILFCILEETENPYKKPQRKIFIRNAPLR